MYSFTYSAICLSVSVTAFTAFKPPLTAFFRLNWAKAGFVPAKQTSNKTIFQMFFIFFTLLILVEWNQPENRTVRTIQQLRKEYIPAMAKWPYGYATDDTTRKGCSLPTERGCRVLSVRFGYIRLPCTPTMPYICRYFSGGDTLFPNWYKPMVPDICIISCDAACRTYTRPATASKARLPITRVK